MQSFCSAMLGYAIPTADFYQTIVSDVTTIVTQSAVQTRIVPETITAAVYGKRDVTTTLTPLALTTPAALEGYSDDFVSSGCAAAVPSPTSTSTAYSTTLYTSTVVDTVSVISTTTTLVPVATATGTLVDVGGILIDPSFELDSTAWQGWDTTTYGIISVDDAYQGNNVMQLNTSTTDHANGGASFYQFVSWNTTATYTVSFEVMPINLPSSCSFYFRWYFTNYANVYLNSSTTWSQFSYTVPGSTEHIQVILDCSDVAEIYVDAFQVTLQD